MLKVVVVSNDCALYNFCQNLYSKDVVVKQVLPCFACLEKEQCCDTVVLFDFSLVEKGNVSLFDEIYATCVSVRIIVLASEPSFPVASALLTGKVEKIITLPCSVDYLYEYICVCDQYLKTRKQNTPLIKFPKSFIGISEQMHILKQKMLLLSQGDFPVLILGETGTGKSYVARLLHELSLRKNSNFVEENIAAIQETLIEGELFGTKTGAYTGAVNRRGLFDLANNGTLFLDEIACIKSNIQAKLLQVLETGRFRAVGSLESSYTNVRLISATNAPLHTLKKNHFFRSDLYYRISSMQLSIPPLRERKEDIVVLAEHFLQQICEKTGIEKRFSYDATAKLEKHNWLGNIREIKQCIECSHCLSTSEVIFATDVNFIP